MRAKIASSAIEKVEAAGPDGKVRLLLKLNDLLLTDAEMEFVRGLGGEVIGPDRGGVHSRSALEDVGGAFADRCGDRVRRANFTPLN